MQLTGNAMSTTLLIISSLGASSCSGRSLHPLTLVSSRVRIVTRRLLLSRSSTTTRPTPPAPTMAKLVNDDMERVGEKLGVCLQKQIGL